MRAARPNVPDPDLPMVELAASDLLRLRAGDCIRPAGGGWMMLVDPPRQDGVYGSVVWLFCESIEDNPGARRMWQATAPIRADVARAEW